MIPTYVQRWYENTELKANKELNNFHDKVTCKFANDTVSEVWEGGISIPYETVSRNIILPIKLKKQ